MLNALRSKLNTLLWTEFNFFLIKNVCVHCFGAECMQEIGTVNIYNQQFEIKMNILLNYNRQILNQAPNSQHRSNILKYRQMSCAFFFWIFWKVVYSHEPHERIINHSAFTITMWRFTIGDWTVVWSKET